MKTDMSASELRSIINQGQRLSEELLKLCNTSIEDKTPKVSLARTLGFNHRTAPCRLVIPLEATLTPVLPTNHEPSFLKSFRAFPHDPITIESKQYFIFPKTLHACLTLYYQPFSTMLSFSTRCRNPVRSVSGAQTETFTASYASQKMIFAKTSG